MNKNKKVVALIILVILGTIVIGCTSYQRPDPERFGTSYYNNNTPLVDRDREMDKYSTNLLGQYNRRKLERSIEGLVGIEDATVVKDGETCYVGIDSIPGTAAVENPSALRSQIGSIIRSNDKNIKRVFVSTDENVLKTLKTFARDIDMGKSINDRSKELEDLFD